MNDNEQRIEILDAYITKLQACLLYLEGGARTLMMHPSQIDFAHDALGKHVELTTMMNTARGRKAFYENNSDI